MIHAVALLLLVVLASGLTSCAGRLARQPAAERGWASWYGPDFHGRRTANGEIYDMDAFTAAHRSLPFESLVEVYNRDNGLSVQVRINDRGPFVAGRIIDLSRAAAETIEMVGPGTARVELRVVPQPGRSLTSAFFVQVGAFAEPEHAEQLARELALDFAEVGVISIGTIYRVRIGPFEKRRRADKALHRVAKTHPQAFVVEGPLDT